MRVENGIRYYEEGERVLTLTAWYDSLTSSVDAIAYDVPGTKNTVGILAEAVTEKYNVKIREISSKYDNKRCVILCGSYYPDNCSLLL